MGSFFESLENRWLLAAGLRPSTDRSGERGRPAVVAALHQAGGDVVATTVLPHVADIGSPGTIGGYTFTQTSHELYGAGNGIGGVGGADQFGFASATVTQDLTLSARVTSAATGDTGITLRNPGLNAGSPMAALVITSAGTLKFVYRADINGAATSVSLGAVSTPLYLRLSRAGFSVAASYSTDGVVWTTAGPAVTVRFSSGATEAGIAVASGSVNSLGTGTFTNVAVIGEAANWNDNDVGAPAGAGSVGYDSPSGTHRLLAGGSGIGGSADAFNFASQPLGDGAVVARLNALDARGEAGLMVRASAASDASYAAILVSSSGAIRFVSRGVSGDTTTQSGSGSATIPVSVKLVRSGNYVAGYYSPNGGASWTRVGESVLLATPLIALAGLVATANVADNAIVTASFTAVSIGTIASPDAGILTPADETFVDDLEYRTALWFISTQQATSGLFPDRANAQPGGSVGGNFSSAAATGFGLSALAIASSRGWITDGYDRTLKTLNFLWSDADMANPANHGYFYHFVNQTTGQRSGTTELSSIDTALLISGVLSVGQYWKGTAIETLAQQIYDRVDWTFMQPDGVATQLRHGWVPEGAAQGTFLTGKWDSWNEGPILYLLAMGSTTHPISAGSWLSFPRYLFNTTYAGLKFYHASNSPLFTNQYPQGWFDLRGKADIADADPGTAVVHMDPYQNSINHTLAQRQALIDAANGSDVRFDYYGPNAWGLTASDSRTGYTVFGGPPFTSNVNGTIVPTAPGGSLAFTPRQSVDALVNLKTTYPSSYRAWGFIDAFNPRPGVENWYDNDALGIDQGMMLVAAENLRSGLIWDLFMATAPAQKAVSLAFTNNLSLVPPTLTSSQFSFETGQSVTLTISQDVAATFTAGDIVVRNVTTGTVVNPATWTFARSSAGQPTSATVTFTSILGDGNYELRVLSNSVATTNGASNVAELVVPFRVLAGDANRDGTVGFDDLVVLAQNYGQSGRTFSQGNFDYSAGGTVDFDDLVLLAQRYQSSPGATFASVLPSPKAATKDRRRPATDLL